MMRTTLLTFGALALAIAAQTRAQTRTNPFLPALDHLSLKAEGIADDAGRVCRLDLTAIPQAGSNLSKLRVVELELSELRRRFGARADFPAAEARRIAGRIESLEAALVRLKGARELAKPRGAAPDASAQVFFEAVQTLCPGDSASVFDDVCKAQGGTPHEECEECFFGLFTCCEKFCSLG